MQTSAIEEQRQSHIKNKSVATVRFYDGTELFGVYDLESKELSDSLHSSYEKAQYHFDKGISRMLSTPFVDQERAEVIVNGKVLFTVLASKRQLHVINENIK